MAKHRLGLYTASESDGGQFEDRGYITEVIYCGSDQNYDSRKAKTQQAGTGEEQESRTSAAGENTV